MGSHDGAIRDDPFQIRIGGKVLKQLMPDTALFPAGIPFIDTIPFAIGSGQQAPLGAAASHPEHRFDKAAALEFVADIEAGTGLQESINALPGLIR
jgi:hypothetical protein